MPSGVGRRQPITGVVAELAGQKGDATPARMIPITFSAPRARAGVRELRLDPVPQGLAEDGRMLAVPDPGLVADLADVDRVAQERVDLAARERCAALNPAGAEAVPFGPQAQVIGQAHDRVQTAKLVVEREERPHRHCQRNLDFPGRGSVGRSRLEGTVMCGRLRLCKD